MNQFRHATYLLTFTVLICRTWAAENSGDWLQFRGPAASGVADGLDAPRDWDVAKKKNVLWKTPIPGLGHACPIVTGDRVFIVTAISGKKDNSLRVGIYGDIASVDDHSKHTWRLYCLDKKTGAVSWEKDLHQGVPIVKRHTKASHANSTPVTDGTHVVVFLGSEGLYCYDVSGNFVWKKDLGVLDSGYFAVPEAQWGFGSSPILYRGKVIVQCDIQKGSFLAAFHVETGKEIWRTPRDEVPTWSTPTIYESPGRTELVVNGYKHIGAYDPNSGKSLWHLEGGGDIPVPTPIVAHDLIFITNAHGNLAPLLAVKPGATGHLGDQTKIPTSEHVAWYTGRGGVYLQTPIVYGEHLYFCKGSGILVCLEARTGNFVYRKRLGPGLTGFTPSPVAADGKIYFTSEKGNVYVVKAGTEYELLATNPLGEICMATPAISKGMMIFRTQAHVMAVGKK